MYYKIVYFTLTLFYISNLCSLAQAEIKNILDSDELLTCDYTHLESQLESLKTGNELLKLRYEMLQTRLDKETELLQSWEDKIDKIPQSIERLESKLLRRNQEQHDEVNDLIRKLNQMLQKHLQGPPIDDKGQMISDVKEIVKEHDSLLGNISEKLKNMEKILNNPPWETQTRELSVNISKNLEILQNVEKKLTKVESITATKTDQIAFNRNIQQYFSKNETPKICIKDQEDQQLVCTNKAYPTNCADFNGNYCSNNKCRLYNHIYGSESFLVACDNHNEGGGWTVIQRRINGSVDFYRNWSEYKNGFGNIDGEFFIGLDKLYALTLTLQPMELLIQLQDFNDTLKYAKYDAFLIGNETENYKLLKVGNYYGNAGDSFSHHQGFNFSTKDHDNDEDSGSNCAMDKKGAWWYKSCMWSNLNGKYYNVPQPPKGERGICWNDFHGYDYSMKFVQMMIRPKRL
ncbi:angiopoietin-related protein 7-like [Lucilia cuprina]|uniref:angiopoietin-related protein 7-like n=1 Tax=Lucilia cuprina TaxID=7375 RepID=UPI001F062FD9|nr:angiopoietin-related protein 7-like [Lucilia cuprina]